MPKPDRQIKLALVLVLFIATMSGWYFFIRPRQIAPPAPQEVPFSYTPPDNREKIPQPSKAVLLEDSTRVFLINDSKLTPIAGFKGKRDVKVDGDMFFEVPENSKPFTVRTRLLILTVKGKAVFRVIAYEKEDGEEVQVISGNIYVKKAYKSQFAEPEDLNGEQMVMINISIDLMEKEKFDSRDLRAWRDTVRVKPVPGD